MKPRLGGLHLQILGLIILPLSFALLAIAVVGIQVHQGAMRQLVASRDERAVRSAAAALSEQLHHRESAIFGMSRRLSDGVPSSTLIEQSSFLYSDFDRGLAVIDREGKVIVSNMVMDVEGHPQLLEMLDHVRDDRAIFSTPFRQGGEPVVMAAAQGEERVVVGVFSVSSIMRSTLLGVTSGLEDSSYFLTDSNGEILRIEGADLTVADVSDHIGVAAALRGEVGSSFAPGEDGEHVVAFSPVQPTGWALILEEPWEAVTSPVLDLSLAAPLALIPALLVSLIALWFGARQVIAPLRKLQAQAEEVAKSNYAAMEDAVGGIAEIQNLQQTLAWMAFSIRQAQAALQRYIGSITDAQEDERLRLARELHDETIQDLIAVDQNIQMIRMELGKSTGLDARLGNVREEISDAIKGLRRLIHALRPIYLEDLGLVPALEMLAKETERGYGIEVDFKVTGDAYRLGSVEELAIYRIAQEAFSNTVRHARANRTTLHLEYLKDKFILDVRDDGVGFTPPERAGDLGASGHFGLMGMYERAELIEAQLQLNSTEDMGTHIHVELPTAPVDSRA